MFLARLTYSFILVATVILASTTPLTAEDEVIFFTAENLSKGDGNWYLYVEFSNAKRKIEKGDVLEYEIYLPATNPVLKGGLDVYVENKPDLPDDLKGIPAFRESRLKDQNGIRLHGDGILEPARDKWYHRKFDLSPYAGVTMVRWELVFEGDEFGPYAQFLDNIRVTNGGKTVLDVYRDGDIAKQVKGQGNNGYTRRFTVMSTKRSDVGDPAFMSKMFDIASTRRELRENRDAFHAELDMADLLAKESKDAHMQGHVKQARDAEDNDAYERGDAEAYLRSLHAARKHLHHEHEQMEKYTGHLVGHAHIDLAWLWTWDDAINNIIPQTFNQALKFMDEYEDFTFSQSSATLYQATQVHHPELFQKIVGRVRDGRWEVVGGRWCEGDNNMISAESHARHFLYGQRYFQRHLNTIATVGWEPDTFGHCWTMPQILLKARINSYYFCRGGKDTPLFWWEGPDGSRVLAFEEPATGGWYNDVVDNEKVRELIRFALKTNTRDELMVYGVGNHGGGPTREHIEAALAMKDREGWPVIKFSTATEFFELLYKIADELAIPTIKTDLNPIFDGCYTSQSKIKYLNRKSECATESAEVFSTLANLTDRGFEYPSEKLTAIWQDILWGHHHDTLPGSCIHAAALYAHELLGGALNKAESLGDRARDHLATSYPGAVVVFNPTGSKRTDIVRIDGDVSRIGFGSTSMSLQGNDDGTFFVAEDVPPFGYKVFSAQEGKVIKSGEHLPFQQSNIPGSTHRRELKGQTATAHGGSIAPSFQMLHEVPGDGTAWRIQKVDKTESLDKPVFMQILEDGDVRSRVRRIYRWKNTTITADEIRFAHTPRVDYDVTVDWMEIGDHKNGSQMLKVAIPTGLADGKATAEIPFGDIERPMDGKEYPMLKWVDVSNSERGVTVLNDCKYGYGVQSDGTIRVTLLRAPYNPDPVADVGVHRMRFAILPHEGPLNKAAAVYEGEAFNKPLVAHWNKAADNQSLNTSNSPLRVAVCRVDAPNIIVTAVKRGEDGDNNIVVRAYECAGKQTDVRFELGFDCRSVKEVDLIEQAWIGGAAIKSERKSFSTRFGPYEIRTFLIEVN